MRKCMLLLLLPQGQGSPGWHAQGVGSLPPRDAAQVLRSFMLLPEGEVQLSLLSPAAAQVLRSFMLLPEGEVRELEALAGRVQGADALKAAEDDLLADPPPEFLDALMDTLMAEPVILPKSRAVVDRSTINRCASTAPCMTHHQSRPFVVLGRPSLSPRGFGINPNSTPRSNAGRAHGHAHGGARHPAQEPHRRRPVHHQPVS